MAQCSTWGLAQADEGHTVNSSPSSQVRLAENERDVPMRKSTEPHGKFREWLEAIDQHGPLMTRDMAAAALTVSRQRVHQLISKGQLETVRVGKYRYVPLEGLQAFRARRAPGGRPPTLVDSSDIQPQSGKRKE